MQVIRAESGLRWLELHGSYNRLLSSCIHIKASPQSTKLNTTIAEIKKQVG